MTSISQELRVPNCWVQVPMRPYTAALRVPARVRARVRMVSALMPQRAATDSGGYSRTAASNCARPAVCAARRPSATSCSSNKVWTMPSKK